MGPSIEKLEQLFHTREILSEQKLFGLFDAAGIPQNNCWRTVYRMIFDPQIHQNSNLSLTITKGQLEPIMKQALENARKNIFTEQALISLLDQYNTASFSVCHYQLTDVMDELNNVTGKFKFISMKSQKQVKTLESETLSAVESDCSIEEKIKLIKSNFKKTIKQFKKDMEELEQLSNTDHLTSLYNRRFFDKQLNTEVIQALAEKTWLTLLFLDLDDFKQFNDKYGHVVGDQALKTIAKLIQDVCNDESGRTGIYFFPTRYGGEEFAVILPTLDQKDAFRIAEKIRATVNTYSFVIRNKKGEVKYKNINLTVSIGIATLDHKNDKHHGITALIKDADAAMYAAKKAGKNCIRNRSE